MPTNVAKFMRNWNTQFNCPLCPKNPKSHQLLWCSAPVSWTLTDRSLWARADCQENGSGGRGRLTANRQQLLLEQPHFSRAHLLKAAGNWIISTFLGCRERLVAALETWKGFPAVSSIFCLPFATPSKINGIIWAHFLVEILVKQSLKVRSMPLNVQHVVTYPHWECIKGQLSRIWLLIR